MNTTAIWFWKEWRSQRGPLLAYLGLGYALLALLALVARSAGWVDAANGSYLLFASAISLAAVLVVAAPQCVRGEGHGRDDQLLRRLPGALRSAFAGKLAFVAVLTIGVAMLGLLVGRGVLWLAGASATLTEDGFQLLWQGLLALVAAVPWTFAVAWLLPRPQFAVGVVLLLAAAVALPLRELLDRSPGLERTAPLPSLLALLAGLPFVVGWIACVHGRRGGGWRRSAKLGGATLLLGLLPHALWTGGQAWCYHHLAETATSVVAVGGCSEDARRLLVAVRGNPQWPEQFGMLDLGTQTLTTFAGRGSDSFVVPAGSRHRWWGRSDTGARFWIQYRTVKKHQVTEAVGALLIDLTSGAAHELGADAEAGLRRLPAELQAAIDQEGRQQARFVLSGCGEVYLELPERIVWRDEDGEAHEFAMPPQSCACPAGSGVRYHWFEWNGPDVHSARGHSAFFDPVSGRAVADGEFASRGLVVRSHRTDDCGGLRWDRYYATTDTELPCCLPPRVGLIGFLDDDDALLWRHDGASLPFVYRVADDRMLPIAWPAGLPVLSQWHVFAERDARGRTWIRALHGRDSATWFAIDPTTRIATAMATRVDGPFELIAFAGDAALLHDGGQIVRLDLANGGRTVLFPRAR